MWYDYDEDNRRIRRNAYGYSEEHGYVCDCLRSRDPYEMLCPSCQNYVDAQQEEEAMLDETMESDDEDGAREEDNTPDSF